MHLKQSGLQTCGHTVYTSFHTHEANRKHSSTCCQPTAAFKRGAAPLGSISSTAQKEREKEREEDRDLLASSEEEQEECWNGQNFSLKGIFCTCVQMV